MRRVICFSLVLSLVGVSAFAQNVVLPTKDAKSQKDPISKTQFAEQQRAMFNEADANFDGQVTRDETFRFQSENEKSKFEERFKKLDTDYSGYLTYDEVNAWHATSTEYRVKGLDAAREKLLRAYDLDKNGTISSHELDEYYAKKGEAMLEASGQQARRDFDGKDHDDSGVISLEEYLESKEKEKIRRTQNPRDSNSWIKRDTDSNGAVKRSENEAFITELFEFLDKNKDDELSAKEQGHYGFKASHSFAVTTAVFRKSVK